MAKDDYDVVVYRVLIYLYACLKRRIVFEEETFQASVRKNIDSDEYFIAVLHMMQNEGLIEGLSFKKAWGGVYLLLSDIKDAEITASGVRYLRENRTMAKVGEKMKAAADIIASLASAVGLLP